MIVNPDVIETLKDEELPETDNEDDTPEEKRKKLMKRPPHAWAGMKPLQHQTASDSLNVWWKAQALGLLGNVGDKIVNPLSGKEKPVEYYDPSEISVIPGRHQHSLWDNTVGKDDGVSWDDGGYKHESGAIKLKLPAFRQYIPYEIENPVNKKRELVLPKNHYIPILNPMPLFPRHLHS